MSSAAEIDAALAWAARIESGEAQTYDPYIVALARVVREQRDQISRLQAALGIEGDGPPRWDAVLKELERGQGALGELTPLVGDLDLSVLAGAGQLELEGQVYRLIQEGAVRRVLRTLERVRAVFGYLPREPEA